MFNLKNKNITTPPYELNNLSLRENSQNFRGNPVKKVDCFVAKMANAPRNDGFTLAEVLITLVIIGVIAAITVPTLIAKYQKEQTVTRLKKAYSTLSQTTQRAIADNGPLETWEIEYSKPKKFAEKYLLPYLNVMKNCEYNTTNNCQFNFKSRKNNSKVDVQLDSSFLRFILNDGTMVAMNAINGPNQAYSYVIVDINGVKKPNISGKDVFIFIYFIKNNDHNYLAGKFMGLYPTSPRSSLLSNCKSGSSDEERVWAINTSCAMLIMKDGWQIKDDYPW